MRRTRLVLAVCAFALTATLSSAAAARDNDGGFKTAAAPMLEGKSGWTAEAILSVGDTLPGGFVFEGIPDGIAIGRINGRGTADVLVNHELSLVPFPATRQDNLNATVSRLRLSQHGGGVLKGEYVIPQSAGYQRFCSNFVVGKEHGFERDLLLTNEEARDIVLRQADSWHQPSVSLTEPGAEQAGVVVAYDIKSGAFTSIYGMGRHNHENSVAVPGYGYPVVISGDDTFDAPASQVYLYTAASGADVWSDNGTLYAFVSDNPAINDYGDLSSGMSVGGHFIEVPRAIATGKIDGREVTSADFGYPAPTGIPDGPQWVLEHWSNLHNVFQFIRIEDTAYDRDDPRVMYLADSGEPRAVPNAATGRLMRGPSGTRGPYPNGRIFKLTLGSDPLTGATLEILADFDTGATGGYDNPNAVHNPDNVETTEDALFIQEDPGSHNAQPALPTATNARIWRLDLGTGGLTVVAEVDQSVPGAPSLPNGAWESSGIVDASSILGPGAFLVDVQAHRWDEPVSGGNDPPAAPFREHGQLLVLRAPGS